MKSQHKLKMAAWKVIHQLKELQPNDEAKVPAIFADCARTVEERFDIFQILDEKPGLFGGYTSRDWHSLLRRCRNRPEYKLFDAINHTGEYKR